jgi:hypothetical protein
VLIIFNSSLAVVENFLDDAALFCDWCSAQNELFAIQESLSTRFVAMPQSRGG